MNAQVLESTGEITRRQNLFDIGQELESIFDTFESLEDAGAADEFLKESLEAYFEKVNDNLENKLEAYCAVIEQRTAYAKIRRARADEIDKLATTDENVAKRLKERLKLFLEVTGNEKVETKFRKIRLQNNGGVAPLQFGKWEPVIEDGKPVLDDEGKPVEKFVVQEDEPDLESLPEVYVVKVPTLDTEALRADLEAGIKLPFAQIGQRGRHVRI